MSSRRDAYALVFTVVWPTLLTLTYFVALAGAEAAAQRAVYSVGKAIQFGFPVAWLLWTRRRPFALGRASAGALATGAAFGVCVLVAAKLAFDLALVSGGALDGVPAAVGAKVAGFGIDSAGAYLLLAVFYSVVHSALEEYYWRGFVFARMRERWNLPAAALASAAAFMAHHVVVLCSFFGWGSALAWTLAVGVGCGGAVWAWMVERFGSLYPSWCGHLIVDAAVFWIGYDLLGHFG